LQNADILAELDTEEQTAAPASVDKPVFEAPVVETPVVEDPAIEDPVDELPAVEKPAEVKSEPQVSSGIARLREIAARRAAEQTDTPAAAATTFLQDDTRAVYQHVVAHLEDRAKALTANLQQMGADAPTEVMEECVIQIQWLCDYLNDNGDAQDAPLQRARDTAFDAADLVQLMQLEKRDSAALEAVSLMLQVKRELQADLAA
jgi:hypothetical protein